MPNLRVDLVEARRSQIPELGEALHRALVAGLGMLPDDLFQVFTVHAAEELRFSPTFPAANRDDIIFVQVIASLGYTSEQKRCAYDAIVTNVTALGVSPDTLLISFHEIDPSNWWAPSAAAALDARL